MVRMIMHGCNGVMGRVITDLAKDMDGIKIVAGIDLNTEIAQEYPVFVSLEACNVDADVIVDFASAKAVDHLLDYCAANRMPVVLCTTGLSEAQILKVKETSKQTAVLRSANMSLGINTLLKLLQDAAKVLVTAGFDIEIVEKHHNQKLDAPSGTALALADSVNDAMGGQYYYKYDRTTERAKRDKKEIGISAIRGGTIVGEHDVIFAGKDEVVTFSHTAYSKAIFGKGALEAAMFLAGKEAGLYNMADVIDAAS
ncbi:MAG: 4-hydroxy-tetrahydrodipicolinate reductase [Brotaphodocola sp.]